MQSTEKLFYSDQYIQSFDAKILDIQTISEGQWKNHKAILLDKTAFYPEGGGQPSDTGFIDAYEVIYVYEKNGNIYHIISNNNENNSKSNSNISNDHGSNNKNENSNSENTIGNTNYNNRNNNNKSNNYTSEYFTVQNSNQTLNTAQNNDKNTVVGKLDNLVNVQVQCKINWNRRFDFMQQHTGEHLLSGIMLCNFNANNIGFHLTDHSCQIDFDKVLTENQIVEVERKCNDMIYKNKEVSAKIFSKDHHVEGARKLIGKTYDTIRVISIDDCDSVGCGGTHVKKTGEIGILKILGFAPKKGGVRIEISCGMRALLDYRLKEKIAKQASVFLSSPLEDTDAKLDDYFRKAEETSKLYRVYKKNEMTALIKLKIDEKMQSKELRRIDTVPFIVMMLDIEDSVLFETAFKEVSLKTNAVLIAGHKNRDTSKSIVYAGSQNELRISMNDIVQFILKNLGGKGGGGKTYAKAQCDRESVDEHLLENLILEFIKSINGK